MSEWYDSQKKPSSNFRKSLQERIEKANPRRELTSEEEKRLARLEAIADKLKRGENVQNRQLKTWLSEEEYEHLEYEWQEQLELRSELKDKPTDLKRNRHNWITKRLPFMRKALENLGFIDETWLKTNMIKTTGWAPVGKRLVDYQPFGHWHTQTFVACLRHDRLDAPWIINKPMNRDVFDTYIETQLAPPLRKKDVIILDNLSSHKSTKAEEILKAHGAWFLFLPPYSPDLNPIEMAFSKLKALMRKAAARSYDDLWRKVGQVCDLFSDEECFNYLKAAGYVSE
ncbi:IS630 family transposase [Alphaproteobacteria bacterium]|nr:IS630 family transposase [Alphaproteobacteria bacterium]